MRLAPARREHVGGIHRGIRRLAEGSKSRLGSPQVPCRSSKGRQVGAANRRVRMGRHLRYREGMRRFASALSKNNTVPFVRLWGGDSALSGAYSVR